MNTLSAHRALTLHDLFWRAQAEPLPVYSALYQALLRDILLVEEDEPAYMDLSVVYEIILPKLDMVDGDPAPLLLSVSPVDYDAINCLRLLDPEMSERHTYVYACREELGIATVLAATGTIVASETHRHVPGGPLLIEKILEHVKTQNSCLARIADNEGLASAVVADGRRELPGVHWEKFHIWHKVHVHLKSADAVDWADKAAELERAWDVLRPWSAC